MIKTLLLLIFFLTTFCFISFSQNDCSLKLKEAERLYDEGRIEKIPSILNPCIKNGFNKEDKISALRLLSLVYLYEDNPEKAEDALLQILKMNPEYKVNSTVDDVDYIRLYKLFNTNPVFSLGVHGTLNSTKPILIEAIGTNSYDSINSSYASDGVGIGGGIKGTYHVTEEIDISFEPSFYTSNFILNESVTTVEKNQVKEQVSYLSFPVYGSYGFYQINNALLYAELGFAYSYLLKGSQEVKTIFTNDLNTDRPLPSFSTNNIRKQHNFSTIVGVGSKVYLPRSYLQLSLRYSFGLNNIVQTNLVNTEAVQDAQWKNGHLDNHIRLSHLMFTLSYNYEFYRHKRSR